MPDPAWMSQYTTKTRAMFRDLLRIHDRIENQDADVPPEVDLLRDWNDSLHRIEKQLEQVHQNTSMLEGMAHIIATAIKNIAPHAEKLYPSKKK